MSMQTDIGYAGPDDMDFLADHIDKIPRDALADELARGRVLVARRQGRAGGLLHMGFFWDDLPFMKLLVVDRSWRGQGVGSRLVEFWQREMAGRGHRRVMTSTMSSETAQHFYRKLGYVDVGGFVLPGEVLELLLVKDLP
jgi:GNAT superfamily N-acetyltransferase